MRPLLEIHDRQSALDYLYAHIDYERVQPVPYRSREFKLDRMQRLLSRLGDPHLGRPVVHVAGTKGKGSVASMIASILGSAGYRTGLYTSPHLERLEERFLVDGQQCDECELVRLVHQVQDAVQRLARDAWDDAPVTYFELTTAMAFLHFARQNVDLAVLEVGLGGRLDSTNVCQPVVSVITSIGYDHMKQLGNSLSSIAGEKAGIIKSAVPVVSGVTQWEPAEVIRQRARQNGCRLSELECDFGFDYHGLSASWEPHAPLPLQRTRIDYWECLNGRRHQRLGLRVGLLGRHQAANAAVALATIRTLESAGWTAEDDAVRRGLLAVRCPARIEVVSHAPMVILDTAHNVSSVQALLAVLDEVSCGRRRILVFAASRDKQVREMLTYLLPAFQHVLLTQFLENPRSCAPRSLYEVARPLADSLGLAALPLTLHDSPHDAWTQARRLARDEDVICVTGSFFLVSEIRGVVAPKRVEVLLPLAGQPPRSDQQRHPL